MSFISQKAGFAVIKMTVRDGTGGPAIFFHDFLVGWMNLNSIVLCNSADPGPCTGPTTDVITDVAGQSTPNILEANVTGNIPLLQNFNELGIGHPITIPDGTTVPGVVLPDDWATLATSRLATVQGPLSDPATFWDTHDDTLATEGHAQESPARRVQPRVLTGIDAVDQCTDPGTLAAADERGGFSAIWLFNTPGRAERRSQLWPVRPDAFGCDLPLRRQDRSGRCPDAVGADRLHDRSQHRWSDGHLRCGFVHEGRQGSVPRPVGAERRRR